MKKKSLAALLLLLVVALCLGILSGCTVEESSTRRSKKDRTEATGTPEDAVETEGPEGTEEPQEDESPDFRNITWGMTAREVKRSEDTEPQGEENDLVVYDVSVAGLDSTLAYCFDDEGGCYGAVYIFNETHSNKNRYIDDYDKLVDALTEKYGQPEYNHPVWDNTLFKDDPEDYGLAVSIGHLVYGARWQTPSTEVFLVLSGDNYKCTLAIRYRSRTYQAATTSRSDGL